MKLVQYSIHNRRRYGIIKENTGIIDLFLRLGDRYPTLKSLLENNALPEAATFRYDNPDHDIQAIPFLPVIDEPGKIICAGMNYAEKRKEFNEINPAPTLFIRFPDTQVGHNSALLKPNNTCEFDYEGELAVIIGKTGKHIKRAEALQYVAGYSCYMDGSVRDWQHSWFTAGKNWQETGAFGPWMVTTDEITNPHELDIRTYLNGQMVQNDNTGNMVHSIPELIEYISTFATLSAGDVIITGSPGGVGKKRTPPLFLKEGDIIEVEIQKIGKLCNQIASEQVFS